MASEVSLLSNLTLYCCSFETVTFPRAIRSRCFDLLMLCAQSGDGEAKRMLCIILQSLDQRSACDYLVQTGSWAPVEDVNALDACFHCFDLSPCYDIWLQLGKDREQTILSAMLEVFPGKPFHGCDMYDD